MEAACKGGPLGMDQEAVGMSYREALGLMEKGLRVTRFGWNGSAYLYRALGPVAEQGVGSDPRSAYLMEQRADGSRPSVWLGTSEDVERNDWITWASRKG